MNKKIFIASDHAGYELKNTLVEFLSDEGFEVIDKGPEKYQKDDDYPEYIIDAAKAVRDEDNSLGIVLGYSGQGEALAANKVDGIRAAVYYGENPEITELSRKHNNANILSLGAGFIGDEEAKREVLNWLKADFTGAERHKRRIKEIELYENRKILKFYLPYLQVIKKI
ncbi:MAG: ribose 5-phosphate isomerase [Candidatus Nanosalina sp. J07AB43]|nr:MAG: ribose 5-phosphate isomerase [Candidatus Nanosalina sp. J07AB43]